MIQPQKAIISKFASTTSFRAASISNSKRYFSSTAATEQPEAESPAQEQAPEERDPFTQNNASHIKYVPKKSYNYNFATPDGRMALVYQGGEKLFSRGNYWKAAASLTLPALAAAHVAVPASLALFAYPIATLPLLGALYDRQKANEKLKANIYKMYLMQNGEQLIYETYDRVLHKVQIINNGAYQVLNNEKGKIVFVSLNAAGTFCINTDGAAMIDFQLIDRLVKGVCIDTRREATVYHRAYSRQVPKNLRPIQTIVYTPQWFSTKYTSSVFIWKYLNRTLYREYDAEAPASFNYWLRNKHDRSSDSEEAKALREEFGLSNVYPSDLFYKTHKISQSDFLAKLRKARDAGKPEKVEKYILSLFKDESQTGRRGVRTLDSSIKITKKKMNTKDKERSFVNKFADEGMSTKEIRQSGFLRHNMLY